MAAISSCVSCTSLPVKARSVACKTSRCPDCKSELGVTSYGAVFRLPPATPILVPTLLWWLIGGATVFTSAAALTGFALWSGDHIVPPRAVAMARPTPDALAHVPEVALEDSFPPSITSEAGKTRVRRLIAQINRENQGAAHKDAFLLSQMKKRPQLRGLPFVMGDACRLELHRAKSFQAAVVAVRTAVESTNGHGVQFWNTYEQQFSTNMHDPQSGVAALSQILGPERSVLRVELIQKLAGWPLPEATQLIARAAIFDFDANVRREAVKALRDRPAAESSDVLLQGIRYPLDLIASRSANAIIEIDRKDLLPNLAEFLDEPAPGDPESQKLAEGEGVKYVVREVVKINHHRNCLLCHAPAETGQSHEVPALIPIPGSSFPSSAREYYGERQFDSEPTVRADTTYLRQDFSVMLPVENAAPWPAMQRFDFLVRSREVEGHELQRLQAQVQARPAGYRSDNQKAALRVLRELTRQNVAGNTAAWREVLAKR